MKLARGTSSWLGVAFAAAVLATAAALLVGPVWWAAAALLWVLVALLVNFFRDPERAPGEGLVSPADGVVTEVTTAEDGRSRVNVFMNPLDVHVNRAPLDARIVSVTPMAGGFVPAFRKESERNERVLIEYETAVGRVTTVQIAGTVARRIVPYVKAGDVVRKGDRIGIIRLGSRVDIYFPAVGDVLVRPGQRVVAGVTTIARLPEKEAGA